MPAGPVPPDSVLTLPLDAIEVMIGEALPADEFAAKDASDAEKRKVARRWFENNLAGFRGHVCGAEPVRKALTDPGKKDRNAIRNPSGDHRINFAAVPLQAPGRADLPLGALARLQVLTRRLLWHLAQDEPEGTVLGSTLDEPDPAWELAPDQVPLFGEVATQDDSQYWGALAQFDNRTPTDEARVTLANDFLDTGFLLLALHEVIHIAARHDRLLELARAEDPRIPRHLGLPQLRRGMEIQADVVAAENLARFLALDPAMAPRMDEDPEIEVYKSSFALAALFGMYDTHRKSISEYDSRPTCTRSSATSSPTKPREQCWATCARTSTRPPSRTAWLASAIAPAPTAPWSGTAWAGCTATLPRDRLSRPGATSPSLR